MRPSPSRSVALSSGLLIATLAVAAVVACAEDHTAAEPGPDSEQPEPEPHRYTRQQCRDLSAGEMFSQRIAPLLDEDRPKTCNECHLSGIGLGAFVRDDACETMACLVEDGLVDLDDPEQSQILSWIERADPLSPLITEGVIAEEYEGFLDWIEYSADCGTTACAGAECGARKDQPFCENEPQPGLDDVRAVAEMDHDCTDLGLERLFRESVYRGRGRCFPCHFDVAADDIAGNPPRWIKTEGSCAEGSLATLREIERGGLIDVEEPDQSLLLLKPLDEAVGGVEHGGDAKFHSLEDAGYVNALLFIQKYVECENENGATPDAATPAGAAPEIAGDGDRDGGEQ
jgi:hypothetical protein